jgi:hypothetical protein
MVSPHDLEPHHAHRPLLPALLAYEERCEARQAFAKAIAGQMAAFASSTTQG